MSYIPLQRGLTSMKEKCNFEACGECPTAKWIQQAKDPTVNSSRQCSLLGYVFYDWGLLWQEVLPCPSPFYKDNLLVVLTRICSSISYSVCTWAASCVFFGHLCSLQAKPGLFLRHFSEEGCNVLELFAINCWDSVTFVNQEGFGLCLRSAGRINHM